MTYEDINSNLGLKYELRAFFKSDKDGVNCNGLLTEIDNTYKRFIESFRSYQYKDFKDLDKKVEVYYEEIDFEDRQKDDIIFFKDKNQRNFSHVGILVDKWNFFHANESKFGAHVDPIYIFKAMNKDIFIFRPKEVKNDN